ncbi:small membrane protein [Pluralibacter gergoviae]|uniref:Small membrane protein n=1 Tax=Pluralibacter gergoviae TaxID=61647 RepID=A0AAI9DJF2_PLUGE|nr:small membrane protein [Pluralibacter gergoviae]EKT9641861.1 small membrane protein [Pluralibacter gergoviae]EKV0916468.1 small membrane protein [Pluralibacter gergoviae]EKV0932167.1 small membrane protein [Pluralibacter gergoviae]EKV3545228.1 small membrane protein [Pluralibacter gergoviae]EKV6249098.1 small membrane protein [Pluralibacter gergoviae]
MMNIIMLCVAIVLLVVSIYYLVSFILEKRRQPFAFRKKK